MFKIVEKRMFNRTIYNFRNVIDKKIIEERNICIQIYSGKFKERTIYTMYNSKMEIIEEMWEYINFTKDNRSDNSKIILLYNLQLIYVYCEIFKKNIKNLTKVDFIIFANFIAGKAYNENLIELKTKRRSGETVNKILQNTLDYLKHSNYRKSYNELKKCSHLKTFGYGKKKEIRIDEKNYITQEEYKKIISYIRNDLSIEKITRFKYELIVRLMFESGLRCGECLGLTFEDFYRLSNKYGPFGLIVIRNRTTDSKRQSAKTCSKIKSVDEYKTKEYGQDSVDYQKAYTSIQTINDLEKYIEEAHGKAMQQKDYSKSIADNISDDTFENHYIFLNRFNGSCMNYSLMNNYLKKMFNDLKIPKTPHNRVNYAHRFRHGFIIGKLYIDNLSESEVIELSRHTTVKGLVPYRSLSIKDISERNILLERYLEGKR